MTTLVDELDPLGWAKKPKSQKALDLLLVGVKEGGDTRLAEIQAKHLADGVCDESGKLLHRWDGVLQWISLSATQYRDAA